MTTGRINQVDIVPPSEEQPRHIALTKGSLDTYIALTKSKPRHIHRTYQRQPRHMHRTYPKAASTHTSHLPSAASTHTSHLPKGSLDTYIALTIGSLDTSHLPSHGGLPNSFATECRRPLQGMTLKESSHVKTQLHFRARKGQAQQPQPESNTAFRCISGPQGTTVYQIPRTRD